MDEIAPPITVLPQSGNGTVEHYYHFLLSYLLPLEIYISQQGPSVLTLRDCGPMNPWLSLLNPATELVLRPAEDLFAERAADDKSFPHLYTFEGKERLARASRIHAARHGILSRSGVNMSRTENRVTLINRAPALPFYRGEKSEHKTSGADRRSIPNFAELAENLSTEAPLHTFEGEHLSPLQQLAAMSQTSVLIGQHGAGLANMVWMPPGGAVIEILPITARAQVNQLFRTLARLCGHEYVVVAQDGKHSPVDVGEVSKALAAQKWRSHVAFTS